MNLYMYKAFIKHTIQPVLNRFCKYSRNPAILGTAEVVNLLVSILIQCFALSVCISARITLTSLCVARITLFLVRPDTAKEALIVFWNTAKAGGH